MKTSKYKGVFLTTETNKYGKSYQYWIASLYVNGVRHIKRCATEDRAAKEYELLVKTHCSAFERANKTLLSQIQ